MPILTKLDSNIIRILRCPLCKGSLNVKSDQFVCIDCASQYPITSTSNGKVPDFRIHRPDYVIPGAFRKRELIQNIFEKYERDVMERDSLQYYLDEIESVREIYTDEFHISGSVLDVGGLQGKLRHYLSDREVPLYVSVDPVLDPFEYANPNLFRAYPCLSVPFNFLCSHAENLPFISNSFDFVHMRSVVDHFTDPYLAFREAYRVLKHDGRIMIGLTIIERVARQNVLQSFSEKKRSEGTFSALKATARVFKLIPEEHMFRLKYDELCDLITATGFTATKEYWQKPGGYVIYLSAAKKMCDNL